MLRSTIQNGISTTRLADHLNDRLLSSGLMKRFTNLVIMIDTGKQCTLAGCSKSYEEFKKTGVLKNFTGYGQRPALFHEAHFNEAPLRLMTFGQTYGNDKYKESKLVIIIFFSVNPLVHRYFLLLNCVKCIFQTLLIYQNWIMFLTPNQLGLVSCNRFYLYVFAAMIKIDVFRKVQLNL